MIFEHSKHMRKKIVALYMITTHGDRMIHDYQIEFFINNAYLLKGITNLYIRIRHILSQVLFANGIELPDCQCLEFTCQMFCLAPFSRSIAKAIQDIKLTDICYLIDPI